MSINKFEQDSLDQINALQEGLALSLFKFFNKGKVRKMLKKYEDDPELQAITADWNAQSRKLEKMIKNYRKRNPNKKLPWE